MNFWSAQVSNRFWSSLLMALTVFLIAGCKVEDKTWIDKMLSEVGLAFAEADKAGLGQEGRDAAMVKAAHRYFPTGMRKEDAFVLLHEMKNNGFDISEYRHEGARKWPGGELRPYMDEATRRNLQRQYPPGVSEVVAVRTWRSRLVVEEFFAISITIPDDTGLISRVSVNRSASFL
jgi:hypothetical protein